MRRLMAICAAATMLIGVPAMAQPYDGRGYDRGYDRGYERAPDRGYDRGYRGDRRWDNRRDYRGGGNAWRRHVRRCSARYRTYNPRTDRYVVRRGVTARCRL